MNKTQKIIFSMIIILIFLSFLVFKTDDIKNIQVKTIETQVQVSENNNSVKTENISKNKTEELLLEPETTQNLIETSTGENSEENSEPKEVSVVAEDILYPEEYDLSYFEDNTVMTTIGHPVKIDTGSFLTLKEGDVFEISFGGYDFKFLIDDVTLGGDGKTSNSFKVESDSKEYSNATLSFRYSEYSEDNSTYLRVTIDYNGGDALLIQLNNGLGYYYTSEDYQYEFGKQGYSID